MAMGTSIIQRNKKNGNSVKVTIPGEVRKTLGLKEGDQLLFKTEGEKFVVEKVV